MTKSDTTQEEKLQDFDHDDTSSEKMSTLDMNKKIETPNLDNQDFTHTKQQDHTELENTNEYPHGTRLVFVILSLILSVFLVCVDQVSDCPDLYMICSTLTLDFNRLYWLQQFQKSQTSFTG
jgi:hypothetical protein